MRARTKAVAVLAVVMAMAVLTVTACSGSSSVQSAPELTPDQREDPVLVTGERVFAGQCATCHGADGRGREEIGPTLFDIETRYPNLDDHISIITDGRGAMPAWTGRLTPQEIEAVARYERQVL